ncbi:MAG: hypothetical protein AAF206_00835 [Bacteroidota bacterium]
MALLSACGEGESGPKICQEFHGNGALKHEVPCLNGVPEGEMKIYHANGDLRATKFFVNGLEEDTARYFYSKTGDVLKTVPMIAGKRNGQAIEYDKKGRLIETTDYQEDLKHGAEIRYFPDSEQIQEKKEYAEGYLHGKYAAFSAAGNPVREGEYYYDRKFGKWRMFRKDGSLLATFTYFSGQRQGGFGVFRKNGIPFLSGQYQEGKIQGEVKYFNSGGEIRRVENWFDGQKTGSVASENPSFQADNFKIQILEDTVIIR